MKRLCLILSLMLFVSLLTGCDLFLPQKEASTRPSSAQRPSTMPTIAEETIPSTQPAPTQEATIAPTAPTQEPTAAQPSGHSAQIEQIRTWYREIVNNPNLQSTVYGTSATVYRNNGQVVCIEEYHQLNDAMDPAMATVHFYYHNGTPFFIFIEYENYQYDEVRLYFVDGQLIRWIINDNAPNDNIPSAQWQPYYTDAVNALNNLP